MKRWNLVKLIQKYGSGSYRDFEGLADAKELEPLVRLGDDYIWQVYAGCFGGGEGFTSADDQEFEHALRDIGLNLIYELVDQAGIDTLTAEMCEGIFFAVASMLQCGQWTRVPETDENLFKETSDD